MLCYTMLCCTMLYHAMPCYAMLCHAIPRCAMSRCSEGKLQQAMACLEDVYNECVEQNKARNQQASDLNLMLDVGKWRRGMEKLCDNIDCEWGQLHEQGGGPCTLR
eukprot:TRINITY_DN163773_c0_g1_i1.p2 TRINITY_DN163773_c0_g1~~TRINITY_DN163773_c0_g1_i1.p2  ORF type:complete len:106 (-),score=18.68 TRINITY_DN163773_c0_g1_i1:3-320(-)